MDRSQKIVRTSVVGIVVNLILVAFKAVVGLATNSIAVILDAVNNLSDAMSSTRSSPPGGRTKSTPMVMDALNISPASSSR